MGNVIAYVMAFLITFPFLATIIVYFIMLQVTNHKLKAFHKAVNWTTLLYMIVTMYLSYVLFGYYLVSFILGLVLIIIITVIFIQWKNRTEIIFHRALQISWRIYFLMFLLLYIVLISIGVLQRIFNY